MSTPEFKNWDEAQANGFIGIKSAKSLVLASGLKQKSHCQHWLEIIDDSGRGSFGYSYVLRLGYDMDEYGTSRQWRDFISSVTINLSEAKNAGGGTGAWTNAFHRDKLEMAIEEALKFVQNSLVANHGT